MIRPLNQKLTRLGEAFNDPYNPLFIPTKLEGGELPISLPPAKMEGLITQRDPQATIDGRLEQVETLSQPPITEDKPVKRKPGRPKGSRNKKSLPLLNEELSCKKLSPGKLSKRVPVSLKSSHFTSAKGQNSLVYTFLYAGQLTPREIEILLENAEALELTAAENIALSLIDRTVKHDQKAEKIYWDILKDQAKNEKITPVNPTTSLLDEALASAEEAIFEDSMKKPIDNPDSV